MRAAVSMYSIASLFGMWVGLWVAAFRLYAVPSLYCFSIIRDLMPLAFSDVNNICYSKKYIYKNGKCCKGKK